MMKSFRELIILTVLVLQILVFLFVFSSDGTLLVKFLTASRGGVPEKEKVVVKIEEYRGRKGRYPEELERVGLGRRYGTVLLEYASTVDRFELCYHYFPYLGGMTFCYDSKTGAWQTR